MVSIVIVAHSEQLAIGVAELASQMAGEDPVPVFPAGGTEDGRLGTSFEKVEQALQKALEKGDSALILVDLGSAVMVTQMAIESLPEEMQQRIRMTNAPLTEGALAAVVAAAGGDELEAVQRAAEQALSTPKIPEATPAEAAVAPRRKEGGAEERSVELVVPNPTGLHARPAARFVRTAMRFDAQITVRNVTQGHPRANAKSMMEVANTGTAWQGERIRITAEGEDADEALEALRTLVESGFGEMEVAEERPVAEEPAEPSEPSPAPPTPAAKETGEIHGIPASEGFVVAPAFIHHPPELDVERTTVADADDEVSRLHDALRQARKQLTELQEDVAEHDQDVAEIFEFQRMMLEDPTLVDAVEEEIRQASCNAEAAVEQVIDEWVRRFETGEDTLMRLRAADVRDAGNRVLRILLGIAEERPLCALPGAAIVVADELTPSDTAQMDREKVRGICTAGGGATSHVAILARMWNLPAVVGLGESVLRIPEGTPLAVDGQAGLVQIDPPPEVIHEFETQRRQRAARLERAMARRDAPATTQDGHQVEVVANIGDVASAQEALELGAEGVGLLRTEFLYLERSTIPDEEEQYQAYRAIADVMGQRPLTIRTLDVGGDKPLPYADLEPEMNPFLGVRAIRLALRRPDLFQPQLRAILRAAKGRNVKVMFPLIATYEEVAQAREALEKAHEDLSREGVPHAEDIDVGIMVETPAAALQAHNIAPLVDFFSIGSNDLTQYTLACDRGNEQLGDLFQALDPAVLRLIRRVIDAAHAEGKWAGLCGELAGQRRAIPMLLGLGLDEFSMTPRAIPEAKQVIHALRLSEAQEIADRALSLPTVAAVKEYLDAVLEDLEPPQPE
ncbi:MAG: phosphoenolpyruvate--protein phosphotransferase [Chloroflexota bacterium]|nr:phosphoenolpyruvate--protein phosphotransferase [Chloroflexota bacterium]